MAEKAIAATITDPQEDSQDDGRRRQARRPPRGKTASDEDEYGKVGDGGDPDGEGPEQA
jgi:hypothetical protein